MLKHEHFEKLCAAASLGDATPEELFELEQHAAACEACQQLYWDCLNIDAQHAALCDGDPPLSVREAQDSLNSQLAVGRFIEHAQTEGVVFSQQAEDRSRKLEPQLQVRPKVRWRPKLALAFAVPAAMISGIVLGYSYARRSSEIALRLVPEQRATESRTDTLASSINQRVTELTATNGNLRAEIEHLKAALSTANEELHTTKNDLTVSTQDREKLTALHSAVESRLNSIEQALEQSQVIAATAQQEATHQRMHSSDVEATLVADKIKINDLSDELAEKSRALDQERQLLALGHDVTDLMGARNLHIVDVVDTDPKGKVRPAFGRIFFTEGKSLIFYAFDLNEAKMQKADYQYHVWSKREHGEKQIRNLGIFYSDDKNQRRWVFKCEDPNVLSEIDSVFVTMEPSEGDPSHPKGHNLMYAYLRGQPTHP